MFAADRLIEQLAAAQLGLVTRAQLRAHGITAHAIANRARAKRLVPLHRGVYRVGPVIAPYSRELAAVLACGPHAVLSHRSAGRLWKLLPDADDTGPIDISLRRGDRERSGIRIHRVRLKREDVTAHGGVPVTTPSRTLLDLAAVLASRDLESALALAERSDLLDHGELLALTGRRKGRPGARLLRSLLADAGPAFTRSEAGARFLAMIRKAQLPAPETNVRVESYEVDFFWRRENFVVEVDGFAFHSTARRFENDRRRDARLAAGGVRVMRVTWHQLTREPSSPRPTGPGADPGGNGSVGSAWPAAAI